MSIAQIVEEEFVDPAEVELQPFKAALKKEKAFVAIPRGELLAFAQQQAITFGIGFSVGLAIGAIFNPKR